MQETLLWNEREAKTCSFRSKEESQDYRYFPEPDFVPVVIDQSWLDAVKERLLELPAEKRERYVNQLGLPNYDASVLTLSGELGKKVFQEMYLTGKSAKAIVEKRGLAKISDESEIVALIEYVLREHPDQVDRCKKGKEQLLVFLSVK